MVRVLSCVALLGSAAGLFFKKFDMNTLLLQTHGLESAAAAVPVDEWYPTQKLDHFDSSNTKTWSQRFHVNPEWYGGPGFPVFFYINGENVASPYSTTSPNLFMNELAVKHKAMVVSVEHRFYGKSQPLGDHSVESFKYLSSSQALADAVAVKKYVTKQRNITAASKWVTFGGSYPGMLSGFAKSKYPSHFAGSVASSAPIWTKTNFVEYSEVVAAGLKRAGGEVCLKNIGKALQDYHATHLSSAPGDVALFKKLFNPCAPVKNDLDRMTLDMNVYGIFQSLAQYDGLQPFGLAEACKHFDQANNTALENLATLYQKLGWDDRKCTGVDYTTEWVAPFNTTAVDTAGIGRQWYYQTCAEFGFGQITANSKSIFAVLTYGTLESVYYEWCKQLYGITNTEERVAATLKKYGGLQIDVPNVVWPSGTVDPWWALSMNNNSKPVNVNSAVVDIEGTSHCADMYSRALKRVPEWAHARIESNVAGFLRNQC